MACLLAFSAIRNNDKVGLLLFSDRVELFIPPKKGRSHTLRIIREILFFEPAGRGTAPALALDYLNKVVTRRAVVFFVSDFQTDDFSRELSVSGRRHDFIAVHIQDQREETLPNVGIITLEDAETGRADRDQYRGSRHARAFQRSGRDETRRTESHASPQSASTPSHFELAKIICPRSARFSNNANDAWPCDDLPAVCFFSPPKNSTILRRRLITRCCPPWVIFGGALVALVLCVLIGWWLGRRSQRPKPQPSPRERTLELLDRISREIETLSPYQFSIRVSDILRRYVTDQYQLPVTRQTSVEFLAALAKASPFSEDEKSLLEDFLNRCDLIKFARYDATTEDSRLLLEEATRFVKGGKLEPA